MKRRVLDWPTTTHFEGCREDRNDFLPSFVMGRTRKTGLVSANMVQVKFDGKDLILVHLWGRCGVSFTGGL